jgi:hypothetical protein
MDLSRQKISGEQTEMARLIAAVLAGYATMAVAIMVAFGIAFKLLGIDQLFTPGTYDAAAGWIALSFALGFLGAIAGGWVCSRIAGGPTAPRWLATFVLVLGLFYALPVMLKDDPARGGPRPAEASMSDAMSHAKQPVWVALLNPLVGAMGVVIGAGLRAKPRSGTPPADA